MVSINIPSRRQAQYEISTILNYAINLESFQHRWCIRWTHLSGPGWKSLIRFITYLAAQIATSFGTSKITNRIFGIEIDLVDVMQEQTQFRTTTNFLCLKNLLIAAVAYQ